MRRGTSDGARCGFSVIEILTVITIIGILASILIPVLGSIRSSARTAQCIGNLRQLGAAIALYSEDNHHNLPPVGNSPTNDPLYWHVALHKYTGAEFPIAGGQPQEAIMSPVFVCPDWLDNRENEVFPDIGYAYAAPQGGSGPDWAKRTPYPTIREPSRTILIAEHYEYHFDPKAPGGGSLLSQPTAKGALRHSTQANYLFADGHVGSLIPAEAKMYFPGSP